MRPIIRQHTLGELVLSSGRGTLSNAVSEAVRDGEPIKLVAGVYTTSVDPHPVDVVRRNICQVLGAH